MRVLVHWLSAALIFTAYGLVWSREALDDDILRSVILSLHRQTGLIVLLFLGVRLALRWRHSPTPAASELPRLMRWAAGLSHLALYGLLFAMPLLGWAMTNAQGHEVLLWNLLALPRLVATDPDLSDTLQDGHEWGAWCLLGLVAAHLAAALWHHFVRRDDVLLAMLPRARSAKAPRLHE